MTTVKMLTAAAVLSAAIAAPVFAQGKDRGHSRQALAQLTEQGTDIRSSARSLRLSNTYNAGWAKDPSRAGGEDADSRPAAN